MGQRILPRPVLAAGSTGDTVRPGADSRSGPNQLVIVELEAISEPVAPFVGELRLGHTDF